jgi:hypothetical protein
MGPPVEEKRPAQTHPVALLILEWKIVIVEIANF